MRKTMDGRKALYSNLFPILTIFIVCLIAALFLINKNEPGPCDGRQWKSPQEELACRFPSPPIGRWKAVYTEEFAKAHDLPPENISTDLSPGVDYMEMDVQPYAEGLTACLVNMLIKKPNDVAVYPGSLARNWEEALHARRKLLHFIDLDARKDKLREIASFGLTSRNDTYDPKRSYTTGSSFAFYGEQILEGYDYITANADCYHLISKEKLFPGGFAFTYAKASVWGRDEMRYTRLENPQRPKGKDFFFRRT